MEMFKNGSITNFDSIFSIELSKYKPKNEWVHYKSLNPKNKKFQILGDVLTEINKNNGFFYAQVYKRVQESMKAISLTEVKSVDWIIEEVPDQSNIKFGNDITGSGVIFNYEFSPQILIDINERMIFVYDEFKRTNPMKIELELFEKILLWSNQKLNHYSKTNDSV